MKSISTSIRLRTGIVCLVMAVGGVAHAADPICLEAEGAVNLAQPMVVVDATQKRNKAVVRGASADRYLEIPQGSGNPPKMTNGHAVVEFRVDDAGTYYLWCRVWWFDECGNSMSMNIDDSRPFTFGQDATYKTWHWVRAPRRLKQLKLKAGAHRLNIRNREDGIKLDQVLLTDDKRYVPVGVEDVATRQAETRP